MRVLLRRRWVRVCASGVLAVLVAWVIVCYRVLGHPAVDRATRADAVLVLGPANEDDRALQGVRLVQQSVAPVLVVSVAPDQRGYAGHLCNGETPGVTPICFVPDPATTRGEARELARLAAEHHWRTVVVITSTYHVARARMILRRCYTGTLELVPPPTSLSPPGWAYQAVYQTLGFAKAWLQGGC